MWFLMKVLRKRLVTQQSVIDGSKWRVARLGNTKAGTKELGYM